MNPLPYPLRPDTRIHRLDGTWEAAFLGNIAPDNLEPADISYTHSIAVPSALETYPDWVGARGVFAMRTRFTCSPNTQGLLRLHGTGMWNRFLISDDDGRTFSTLGDVSLPYTPVSLTLPASESANRQLVVLCDNRFSLQQTPLQSEYFDFYAYGGLFRSVEIQEVGDSWIERVHLYTESYEEGLLSVTVIRGGDCTDTAQGRLRVNDNEVAEVTLKAGDTQTHFRVHLPELAPWSPESPTLHLAELTLGGERMIERFGLRKVETSGNQLLLNGKPIYLKGFCRHEAHPQFGPALPHAQLVQDLQLMTSMGCNFVRGSHYPQDQRFLDLCDEMGVLVFEESLGWQQDESDFTSVAYCDACEEQTRLMVRASINHPSIIMWGFLNEGNSEHPSARNLYPRLAKAIREEDTSRWVSYASNHPDHDRHFDLVDVVCVNTYPGWYSDGYTPVSLLHAIKEGLDHIEGVMQENPDAAGKPLLISEIGAGALYGWRDPHRTYWSEEYQADLLKAALNECRNRPAINGVAIWQFCDCRTYTHANALQRPRAFNNKGVFDEYRRPKLSTEVVRTAFRE